MRKVIVATPTYDGRVEGEYALSLAETVRMGAAAGVHFQPVMLKREPIARSRNNLLAAFYYSEASDLLWIDSDISWAPLQAIRILQYPVDVVGGTYPRTEEPSFFVVKCAPEDLLVGDNGLIKVDALGMGFLRMSRRAVEALWDLGEPYQRDGRRQRWVFDEHPEGGEVISEDVAVCLKLKSAGVPIYLDPGITCGHTGTKTWGGDFLAAMQEFNKPKAVPDAA